MQVFLEVNGRAVSADVAPRTHLADFLRETLLLTGTHLGCEHGVCGACTILLDDAPARACIAFAAACDGARVLTIEGLAEDPVMHRLRAAFSREHALQCGYCTPGMLITARDIVRRLPEADDDRIRLELSGNLCRCTGYNGIVRAIRAALDERISAPPAAPPPLPQLRFAAPARTSAPAAAVQAPGGTGLSFDVAFAMPAERVWPALRDPSLIAGCIPGARLTGIEGDRLTGEITTALGPVRARFVGSAQVTYDDDARTGQISGAGQDRGSVTRLSGAARFALRAEGTNSVLTLAIDYSLQGPLAQLARHSIVEAVAQELAHAVGQNLQARLRCEAAPAAELRGLRLIWRAIWRLARGLLRPS